MSLAALRTELSTDPLAIGYAAMSDQQAADAINARTRTRNLASLTGSQVLNAIDKAEFNLLLPADQQKVWNILHLGEINPFGLEAAIFTDLFGGGSATISALAALRRENVSRAEQLGLGAVHAGTVAQARAL